MITDTVMDAIAHIEMHRQEMARETSVAVACSEALRKLHELLEGERQALQSHGAGPGHAANIEAVTAEIDRVKRLASTGGKGAPPRHERGQQGRPAQPTQPHYRARNKGRRTMGRSGGR